MIILFKYNKYLYLFNSTTICESSLVRLRVRYSLVSNENYKITEK